MSELHLVSIEPLAASGSVVGKFEKTLARILHGRSDRNIPFQDLRQLLLQLGFFEHIRGSHHIFAREGMTEILNLQPIGNNAKAYQVKQVRNVIVNYGLAGPAGEELGSGE